MDFLRIEWDIGKARTNLRKHEVSFDEAATIFQDPLSLTVPDPDHSIDERRYLTIGLSLKQRLLVVAHTDEAESIRIISARPPAKGERNDYESK